MRSHAIRKKRYGSILSSQNRTALLLKQFQPTQSNRIT